MAIKLTAQSFNQFEQPVWLKNISSQFHVTGTVSVTELGRVLYTATAVKQTFLLNEEQKLIAKSCYKCGHLFTLDDFYNDKSQLFNKTTSCKHCRAERGKQFRQDNPLYYRRYWLNSRERMQQSALAWRRNNPESIAVSVARNHRKRQEAMERCYPDDTEYLETVNQQKVCVITGLTEGIALDHVLPVTKGRWGNNRGNLLWLSEPLNTSKHNRSVFDWAESMEQERLDYLLPEGIQMSVEEFQQKMTLALTVKAGELGLTLEQYKQKYNEEYYKEEQ